MTRHASWITAGTAAIVTALQASASPFVLYEQAINIDGSVTSGTATPGVNLAAFDTKTGLGTISLQLRGAGTHQVSLFVDHEIDEAINTFFNETATTHGGEAPGQSWEIDEPGFAFGDIADHFKIGKLDNTNAFSAGQTDDVSMAMGWDFSLASDETATVSFVLSALAPANGFYLTHLDDDSGQALHMAGALQIRGQGAGEVPEPATLALVALGLIGQWQAHRRRTGRQADTRKQPGSL